MDFYRKFKSRSNPNSDPVSILNDKEYKCISLQAITNEVIKENNKKQIKSLIEEANGHLADIRIILEEETDKKITERCQNLIKQFEDTLLKLVNNEVNISAKVNESPVSDVNILQGQTPKKENRQSKLILNEVEEKLKAMRQKRLSRLNTFVDGQTKLAEQRSEDARQTHTASSIAGLKSSSEIIKTPLPITNDKKMSISNANSKVVIGSSVITSANKFSQAKNMNKIMLKPVNEIEENPRSHPNSNSNGQNAVENTEVLQKPLVKSRIKLEANTIIIKEKQLEVQEVKHLVTREKKWSPTPPPKIPTANRQGPKTEPKPIAKLPDKMPKNSVEMPLNKLNSSVTDKSDNKTPEDIQESLKNNPILNRPVDKSTTVNNFKQNVENTVENVDNKTGNVQSLKTITTKVSKSNEAATSNDKVIAENPEYFTIDFKKSLTNKPVLNKDNLSTEEILSKDENIKNIIMTKEDQISLSTFGKASKTTEAFDASSGLTVENPEYFEINFTKSVASNNDDLIQEEGSECSKMYQSNIEHRFVNSESKSAESKIDFSKTLPKDENIQNILDPVLKVHTIGANDISRNCDQYLYQKRKLLKRLLVNWDNLAYVLTNDSDSGSEDIEDMLENLEDVSDVIKDVQQSLNEKLQTYQSFRNGQSVSKKLKNLETEISKFTGLRRDSKYLELSNQLTSYFLKINKINCTKFNRNEEKSKILTRINILVTELERKVNKNEAILNKILEEQVESIFARQQKESTGNKS